MEFLDHSHAQAEAQSQSAEAARRRELAQAQELADVRQQRLEQQQRAARRLRQLIAGLSIVAVIAGLACVLAVIAHQRASQLASQASHSALQARSAEREARQAPGAERPRYLLSRSAPIASLAPTRLAAVEPLDVVRIDDPAFLVLTVLSPGPTLSDKERSLLGGARELADAHGGAVVALSMHDEAPLGSAGADRVLRQALSGLPSASSSSRSQRTRTERVSGA